MKHGKPEPWAARAAFDDAMRRGCFLRSKMQARKVVEATVASMRCSGCGFRRERRFSSAISKRFVPPGQTPSRGVSRIAAQFDTTPIVHAVEVLEAWAPPVDAEKQTASAGAATIVAHDAVESSPRSIGPGVSRWERQRQSLCFPL